MNIKEAKMEIQNTLRAYLRKDIAGKYCFPRVRQRPLLLMGPPGVGKTAIVEQVARENGVGLVAYTLTHHTRQSAVGLPKIETLDFDGQQFQVSQYTMSEIIAAVYTYMGKTGKKEGILFLDEINCVSETLAPTMLELLQNKTFGSHAVPEGWVLVTAGNPPQYNKSVRTFDVATLDRVRTISVEPDCNVWLEYAQGGGVHGAIRSYLAIRPEQFYLVEDGAQGKSFVTARGWEDLSELLGSYEALDIPVTRDVVKEYLQKEEVAKDFAAYYQLYQKYQADYGISALLAGSLPQDQWAEKAEMARNGGFEERFAVVQLLVDGLEPWFQRCSQMESRIRTLHGSLLRLRSNWGEGPDALAKGNEKSLQVRLDAGLVADADPERWAIQKLENYDLILRQEHIREPQAGFERIKMLFSQETQEFSGLTRETGQRLARAFRFAEDCFGEGQEMVLFVTDLTRSPQAMDYIAANGSEAFLRHGDALMFASQERTLMEQCRSLMDTI